MNDFSTRLCPTERTVIAPDGSAVRVLLGLRAVEWRTSSWQPKPAAVVAGA